MLGGGLPGRGGGAHSASPVSPMAIANKTSSKETDAQTVIPSHERDASSYRTLEL